MFSPDNLLEYGPLGLFLVAFFESTVFPIPPDVLLLPLCLMTPRLSWWYAFLTTAASLLGAFLGYAVGRKAGRPVIERMFSRELVQKVQALFAKYGGWAVGVAAFTPIPYKVFTFGAGIFRVPFWIFSVASTIGRAARFFLVGGMVYFLGDRARTYLGTNFELATLVVTGILLVAAAMFPKIDAFVRSRRTRPTRVAAGNRTTAASVGYRLSLRSLGIRVWAGLSATTVLLLLVIVYLGDVAGLERAVLNRSLMLLYERMSWVMGLQRAWVVVGSAWFAVVVVLIGVIKYCVWDFRRRDGLSSQGTSGTYRTLARMGLLAAVAYAVENGVSAYLSSAYMGALQLPGGHILLSPYLLMGGAYLISKGMSRPAQLLFLGSAAAMSAGDTANLVLAMNMDAASATASILASGFMLTFSYTVLAVHRPASLSLR